MGPAGEFANSEPPLRLMAPDQRALRHGAAAAPGTGGSMAHRPDLLRQPRLPSLGLSVATISAVALGGALGTVARFLLGGTFYDPSGHFPTTTLIINLSGSLAIGFAVPVVERAGSGVPLLRPFLVVGI